MNISTVMIVKNELKNIKELLPLLHLFSDEIIITDTGSNDGTREFLEKEKNIVLKEFQWENDFSKARNFTINFATKQFIFWIDADDRIDELNIEKIKKMKRNLNSKKVYFFKLINLSDNTLSYQLRLFPNFQGLKFIYPVHEQLRYSTKDFTTEFVDIEIVHTGYVDRETLKLKQLRNIKILESSKNKDFYTYLQLAESYKILKDYIKALEFFKQSINDCKILDKNIEVVGYVLYEIYKILNILNFEDDALEYIFYADKFSESFPVIKYVIGQIYYKRKEFEKSLKYFTEFLHMHIKKHYLNPVPAKLEDSALYFIAKIYIEFNKIKEAIDILKKLLEKYPSNKNYKRELEKCQKLI